VLLVYILELLTEAGVYGFYAQEKSCWAGQSRKHKMSYDKLAAEWRRLGRRLSVESSDSEFRVWDCRKLETDRPSGKVGVLALLFEANVAGQKRYVGYYGTLPELAGLNR
jgi:hypothetical protein